MEVTVGKTPVRFMVHEDVMCANSSFFKAACSSQWRTSGAAIELPEDDPNVFDDYLHCAYSNEAPAPPAQSDVADGEDQYNKNLIHLYILADKLGDITTANYVMDSLVAYSEEENRAPSAETLIVAWTNSAEKSPLRTLCVDFYVTEVAQESFEMAMPKLPLDFVVAIAVAFRRVVELQSHRVVANAFLGRVAMQNRCWYHQHNEQYPVCVW